MTMASIRNLPSWEDARWRFANFAKDDRRQVKAKSVDRSGIPETESAPYPSTPHPLRLFTVNLRDFYGELLICARCLENFVGMKGVIVSNLLFLLSNLLFFPETSSIFSLCLLESYLHLWKTGKKKPCETQDAVPGALLNLSEVAPGECYPERFL